MIAHIISSAKQAGTPVGMCGEAAADPNLIPLWIAYGLDEYSVGATSVLRTRSILSKWTTEEANALAVKVAGLATTAEVEAALTEARK